MKMHVSDNKDRVAVVRQGLKDNDGYCPCIYKSKGKPQYLCICEDFRLNKKVGETCHCGLYVKDEE